MASQRVKQQARGLHGSTPCHLYICYCCYFGGFVGLLIVGAGVSLSLLLALKTLFLELPCPALI